MILFTLGHFIHELICFRVSNQNQCQQHQTLGEGFNGVMNLPGHQHRFYTVSYNFIADIYDADFITVLEQLLLAM